MGFPGALAPKESPFFIKVKCLYVLCRRKEKSAILSDVLPNLPNLIENVLYTRTVWPRGNDFGRKRQNLTNPAINREEATQPCAALLSNVHGHCACSQFILITGSSVRAVNIRQVGRDGVTCGSGASASGRVVACRPCPGVSPVAGRLEGGLPGGSTACPPPCGF